MDPTISPELALEALEQKLKKDKVRFAVCNKDNKHSGIWSAWGNQSDYYLGARSILGSTKISLHQSGHCRVALNDRQARLYAEHGQISREKDRAFIKWKRVATPDQGAAHVVSLFFPTDYLRNSAPQGTPKKPLFVFEADVPRRAIEFGFFYSRESVASLEEKLLQIGKPLFRTDLANGETVSIVARIVDFDPNVLPTSEALNKIGATVFDRDQLPKVGAELKNLNAIFWNKPNDGETLQIIEIGGVSIKRNS